MKFISDKIENQLWDQIPRTPVYQNVSAKISLQVIDQVHNQVNNQVRDQIIGQIKK